MPRKNQPKSLAASGKSIIKNIRHVSSGSETELDDDIKAEQIAELQLLVRALKIENANLKKKLEATKLLKPKVSRASETSTPGKTRRNSTLGIKQKETTGCSCSGSCTNKKCGCVKKETACSEFCKCGDNCKNQIANDGENKENRNNQNQSNKKSVKSKSTADVHNAQNQSSSSIESEHLLVNSTDQTILNTSQNINNSNSTDDPEEGNSPETIRNPLKPRHELRRSPLQNTSGSSNAKINTTIFNDDEVFLPVPKTEPEDELPPPDEINQMEVDWEQHLANLVPCRKCSRKFHPYRIKKHEQSCKQI